MLNVTDETKEHLSNTLDQYGDSYYRDVTKEDLKAVCLTRECVAEDFLLTNCPDLRGEH